MTPALQLASPVPRTALRGLRRQLAIVWHGIVSWALAPGWFSKLLLTLISLGIIVYPVFTAGPWKHAAAYTVAWIMVGLWKAYRELTPKNIQLVQRNYLERKLMLYRLVRDIERAPSLTPPEVLRFQQEALQLIANYVRSHRCDVRGTTIYANLLVQDGDLVKVVARDRDHRYNPWVMSMRLSLVGVALVTGEPKLTGDVYADYPETPPGKPYRSILVIPVRRGNDVLGAVSIDSTRRYHFDREMKNLVDYLNPYVALLAWTLAPPWGRCDAKPAMVPSQEGSP